MKYLKRIDFDNIKNFRDLGGIPTLDKKSTKWHKFYRSACLDDSKDFEIEELKGMGISTIIDLRRNNEIDFDSEIYKKISDNFDFNHISLSPDEEFRRDEIEKIISGKMSVGASYRRLIDHYSAIKEIMETIDKVDGSVIYHCQEGKDRTGIISMILLAIGGVGRDDIIADYEVSSAYLSYIERYGEDEPYSIFRITDPYYMKEAYDYVIRKYRDFESYLKYAGLDEKVIKSLKEKLID